jgi:hypothetical protein
VPRRGRAPRRRSRHARLAQPGPELPGRAHAALADFPHSNVSGGGLLRASTTAQQQLGSREPENTGKFEYLDSAS